jgi:hypothetical protein
MKEEHEMARGRIQAAIYWPGQRLNTALRWEFEKLATDDERAAWVDKWARLAASDIDRCWDVLYRSLLIVREQELYKKAGYMEDLQVRGSFREYWEAVVRKPFATWVELERTYRIVRDTDPGLLEMLATGEPKLTYTEAKARAADAVRQAAAQTTPEVAKKVKRGGDHRSKSRPDIDRQSDRAGRQGIGRHTQMKLDRLASEREDLHARVVAGELSVTAACIEAGWEWPMFKVPDDPAAAAATLRRHFAGGRLAALMVAQARHLSGERLEAVIEELRAIREAADDIDAQTT